MSRDRSWPRKTSTRRCATPRNLQTALEESGAAVRDVLKTTVYVASSNRGNRVTAWDEVAGFFAGHDATSTLVGVAVLGYPRQLVETGHRRQPGTIGVAGPTRSAQAGGNDGGQRRN
jgi:hypothetical protein